MLLGLFCRSVITPRIAQINAKPVNANQRPPHCTIEVKIRIPKAENKLIRAKLLILAWTDFVNTQYDKKPISNKIIMMSIAVAKSFLSLIWIINSPTHITIKVSNWVFAKQAGQPDQVRCYVHDRIRHFLVDLLGRFCNTGQIRTPANMQLKALSICRRRLKFTRQIP